MDEFFVKLADTVLKFEAALQAGLINVVSGFFNLPLNVLLASDFLNKIFNIILPIGVCIMLLYFLLDLYDMAMSEQFTFEIFVKQMIRFIIGYILIVNIDSIMIGANDFTKGLLTDTNLLSQNSVVNIKSSVVVQYANRLMSGNPLSTKELFNLGIRMTIEFTMDMFLFLAIIFAGVKRAIKIGVYYLLSPIMVADAFSRGFAGSIGKTKRIIALYLELPYVLLVCYIATGIINHINAPISSSLFVTFIILWTAAKMINRASEEVARLFSS